MSSPSRIQPPKTDLDRIELDRRASTRRRHLAERSVLDALSPRGGMRHLRERLALASRLSERLAGALDADAVAQLVVDELHRTFNVYLAVIMRLDSDHVMRRVAGAGPLTEIMAEFLLDEQPIDVGVNGRVARSGQVALVADTRADPDYVARDPASDPRSELSVPILVAGTLWGVLNLEEVEPHAFDDDDVVLMQAVAAQLGATLHHCQLYGELEDAFVTTLAVLSEAVEAKDAYTASHEDGVADLAEAIAARLGLDAAVQREIRYGALLHDVGKIATPTEILRKRGPLTDLEWVEMRRHTEVGADMLRRIPFFSAVHPLVRSSHERWDGRGYPDGLIAEQIPLGARIVAAADAFHAMTTDRPYRRALTQPEALAELMRCAGPQFDHNVITALVDIVTTG